MIKKSPSAPSAPKNESFQLTELSTYIKMEEVIELITERIEGEGLELQPAQFHEGKLLQAMDPNIKGALITIDNDDALQLHL